MAAAGAALLAASPAAFAGPADDPANWRKVDAENLLQFTVNGQEILIESLSDSPIAVSFLAERTIFPAFGIEGGKDGAPGELHINGTKTDPKKQYVLNKGDTVSLGTPVVSSSACPPGS